jgi:hypothetical protein
MNPQAPPDTGPGALLVSGLRRGFLLVFLPIAIAGQAFAWIAYAITGVYGPVSWAKIGLAYTLASARVPFEVTSRRGASIETAAPSTEILAVALGALTIVLLVLAFRAGRAQAAGWERIPTGAAAAGSAIGLGVALPMLVAAVPVRLRFPDADVTALEPSLVLAVVMPLLLAGGAGVAGGLAAARDAIEERGTLGGWSVAAARGAAATLTWGVVAATAASALVLALRPGATAWYARSVGTAGPGGAAIVVHHGLVLPNQMVLARAVASGVPVSLRTEEVTLVEVSLQGWDGSGLGDEPAAFPAAYLIFLLVPVGGAAMGGRLAGRGIAARPRAAALGAIAGVAGALLGVGATWLASIELPFLLLDDPVTLGPVSYTRLLGLTVLWGIAGGVVGGALRDPDVSS